MNWGVLLLESSQYGLQFETGTGLLLYERRPVFGGDSFDTLIFDEPRNPFDAQAYDPAFDVSTGAGFAGQTFMKTGFFTPTGTTYQPTGFQNDAFQVGGSAVLVDAPDAMTASGKSLSIVFACGGERATEPGAGVHWDSAVGSVTKDTTHIRSGASALKFVTSGGASYVTRSVTIGHRNLVTRFSIYVTAYPASGVQRLWEWGPTFHYARLTTSGDIILVGGATSLAPLPLNQWVTIDFKLDTSANPHTYDWKINGVAQPQQTNAAAATDITEFDLGDTDGSTATWWIDDFALSYAASNFPVGDGMVVLNGSTEEWFSGSPVYGTAPLVDAPDTMSASGTSILAVTGTSALTDAADTMAASGSEVFTGTSALTDAVDSVAATGALVFIGASALTDAPDEVTGTGTAGTVITGTADLVDAPDQVDASGITFVAVTGTSALTDSPDSVTASGELTITGSAVLEDAPDTMAATGGLTITGTAFLVDAADVVVAAGGLTITGSSVLTDAPDTFTAAGIVANPVTGTATLIDAPDTMTATGRWFFPRSGPIAAADSAPNIRSRDEAVLVGASVSSSHISSEDS